MPPDEDDDLYRWLRGRPAPGDRPARVEHWDGCLVVLVRGVDGAIREYAPPAAFQAHCATRCVGHTSGDDIRAAVRAAQTLTDLAAARRPAR